ncbi:MAG: PaaI family thioesterase [Alphaproteobacteria bacterium]|jgi:uncharacterized protein (TIGR00369 family)|nr:PaaI family thioesterase [Alphaproteobacteria bacterium]MDP6566095.1 PaaI family thioesterase [Alphaproteobacteria bacterium]MDP6816247.1 PaaI family thioesterase [Alphaproteobacteria bacterium]
MPVDFQNVRQALAEGIPHMREVGLELLSADADGVIAKIEHRDHFVGDPETGVIHGGIITVLLDSISGMCIPLVLDEPAIPATLDLRIDYLKPATPKVAIFARAHCYKATRHIAFSRGVAYQDSMDDPIAHCAGSFMLTRPAAAGKGGS